MNSDFEIITLKSGLKSLRSLEHGETFHPVTGPVAEASILHVQQQRLIERSASTAKFIIWDVGLGAAANALTAIAALRGIETPTEIHSFDKTTAPLQFAQTHAQDLGYLSGQHDLLDRLVTNLTVEVTPHLHWHLHLGDFREQIKATDLAAPHAILYDPYSPTSNPEMWTLDHFINLKNRLDSNVPCILTNYTRSTAVRVTLLLAGFYVGTGCDVGEKAETTIASNRFDLLENPLTRKWLERVGVSSNAAPMRELAYSQAAITENDFKNLILAPQFQVN